MPDAEAAVDPTDVTGEAWTPPTAGETNGRVNVASALGLPDQTEETEDEETSEEEESDETSSKGTTQRTQPDKKTRADETKKQLAENADAILQRNMEELYDNARYRARNEEGYLDKLVQSKDPIEQRLAAKIIERNDFGAKTLDDYRKQLRIKNAGKDPRDQKIAELEAAIDEIRGGSKTKEWSDWKSQNRVTGDAETLADQVHSQYPDLPNAHVLAIVRNELGVKATPSLKESVGFVRGSGSAPEEDGVDLSSPLARKLLPNAKKTVKFAKQFMRGR